MKSNRTTISCLAVTLALISATPLHAQGRGGGGMPASFQEKIHQLFAHPEKIRRTVDINSNGYVAKTTSDDPELVSALQTHVRQMSGRLAGGMPVRRWDPAFQEFFDRYDDMEHKFKKLEKGIRAEVTATDPDTVSAIHNHAYIILDFSSLGDSRMHQPHRTVLDDDGGESDRFHGGPPHVRNAKLGKTFAARAGEACNQLVTSLGGQLKAAIKAGGPEAALPVCKAAAIPLTAQVTKNFENLTVTRVSDRQRNPANTPDKLDRIALARFKKSKGEPRLIAHLTTAPDGRSTRYYKPLYISETCLKCHGNRNSMSQNLRDLLDLHYPGDKAVGYSLGDLRGLIRVGRKPPE